MDSLKEAKTLDFLISQVLAYFARIIYYFARLRKLLEIILVQRNFSSTWNGSCANQKLSHLKIEDFLYDLLYSNYKWTWHLKYTYIQSRLPRLLRLLGTTQISKISKFKYQEWWMVSTITIQYVFSFQHISWIFLRNILDT